MRILALGGFLNYIKQPWNTFDFSMVTIGYVSMLPIGGNTAGVRALRALRALRILRTITRFESLRAVVVCFFEVSRGRARRCVRNQVVQGLWFSLIVDCAFTSAIHCRICHSVAAGGAAALRSLLSAYRSTVLLWGGGRAMLHKRFSQHMRHECFQLYQCHRPREYLIWIWQLDV